MPGFSRNISGPAEPGFAGSPLLVARALVCAVVLICSGSALSDIYACSTGTNVVFQDRPCPVIATPQIPEKIQTPRQALAIHESWLELPGEAEERAFCDRRGCECGAIETRHRGSLAEAVADALYLDGSWHRYESSYAEWLQARMGTTDFYLMRERLTEAACEVMISQSLLRNFAEDVLQTLQQREDSVKKAGYDNTKRCEDGDSQACADEDAIHLLTRLKQDASYLKRPRESVLEPSRQASSLSEATLD